MNYLFFLIKPTLFSGTNSATPATQVYCQLTFQVLANFIVKTSRKKCNFSNAYLNIPAEPPPFSAYSKKSVTPLFQRLPEASIFKIGVTYRRRLSGKKRDTLKKQTVKENKEAKQQKTTKNENPFIYISIIILGDLP